MIPIKDKLREKQRSLIPRAHRKLTTYLLVIGCCLALNACTNSKMVIGPLYNQLDNQIRSEFNKLGDFSDEQTEAFEAHLSTFHVWHRQSELPKYASLLQEIAASIAEPEQTRASDVKSWFETAENHSRTARFCYPANFSGPLVQTLTIEQIKFIERRFRNERRKNRERYASQTPKDRVERRLKNLDKWAGRMDLPLTANQRARLRSTLSSQTSLNSQYNALSSQWMQSLFTLARKQSAENYSDELHAHIGKLWTLMETNYPEQWQNNRNLWQQTVVDIEQTLTPEQRASSSRWMNKMANTLLAVAADSPPELASKDSSVGCQVKSNS